MVSSTVGSPTSTGWKRRSRAASFSTYLRYSSRVVAPTTRSSPRASMGFSMLEASTAPSAPPAPTMVCISSMKVTISPSESAISLSTAFRRSSNSPAVLGPGHHGPDVQGDHPLVLEALGHVAGHDALGQSLGDGRLAHSRLADEHRVVLGPAAEHLDDPADLIVAPDHRVEFAPAGQIGEVAAEAFQSLVLLLGVGVLGPLRAADVLEHLEDRVAGDPVALEDVAQPALVGRQSHEHVLGGDVGVLHLVGLGLRRFERLLGLAGQAELGGAVHGGEVVEPLLQLGPQRRVVRADALQDGHGQAAVLIEESWQPGAPVRSGRGRVPAPVSARRPAPPGLSG